MAANDGPTAGLPRRPEPTRTHSRFVEPPMYEYTPAHSVASEEDYQYDDHDNHDNHHSHVELVRHRSPRFRLILRALNAGLHFVACTLLVTIMALFLAHDHNHHHRHRHRRTEPQAISLLVLLAVDMIVDTVTFCRLRAVHVHISIVLAHLALGLAYLTVFMVDVGVGSVFSGGYTFWGLPSSMAGPVVYFFLWVLGVWDLLHTVLHRHQVGRAGGVQVRWLRRGRVATSSTTTTAAVPMRTPTRPGQGLPPVGSTPTAVTAQPNVMPAAAAARGQNRPEDKSLSSYASSASMSTQNTRVDQGSVQTEKDQLVKEEPPT